MDTTPLNDRETELLVAVRETLAKNNSLNQLRAAIRAKVLRIVHGGGTTASFPSQVPAVEKSARLQQFNDLILEYLKWFGYHYSAEMFQTEAQIQSHDDGPASVRHMEVDLPVLLQLFLQTPATSGASAAK